jgi:hypothetical protein
LAIWTNDEVSGLQHERHVAQLDLGVRPYAERARDDVGVGMSLGLIGRERAGVDHPLHDRMIACELPDLAAPKQIGAAVSDMGNFAPGAVHEQRHASGPRSAQVFGGTTELMHEPAGLRDGLREGGSRERSRGRARDRLENRREREPARFLAERVPSHPVADDEEMTEGRRAVAARVFVHLLVGIAPGVALGGDLDPRASRRRVGDHHQITLSQRTEGSTRDER